ncbi:MAG: PQQ-binding-like beta-propeller repeat protein [Candidatus Sumerlaeia bacterium]
MNRRIRISGSILLLVLFISSSLFADDWPQWRGPNRDGISAETDWSSDWSSSKPKVLWRVDIGTGFSSFAISEGRLYTMGNTADSRRAPRDEQKGRVYCLDAARGDEIWRHEYPSALVAVRYEGGPTSTPTVDGDVVYAFGKLGQFFCFNKSDGKIIWQKDLSREYGVQVSMYGLSSSPLIIGERLYLHGGSSTLALNKSDGSLIWKTDGYDGKGAGYSSPVVVRIDGVDCLLSMQAKNLYALQQSDGKVLWQYEWITQHNLNIADPIVIEGDRVFISSDYNHGGTLLKMSREKAEEIWMTRKMRNHFMTSVRFGDYLYGFDDDDLTCLDLKSGQPVWQTREFGKGGLSATADGRLIVLGDEGTLAIVEASPEGPKMLASMPLLDGKCWTMPVLVNGRIYARNAMGNLVCIECPKR